LMSGGPQREGGGALAMHLDAWLLIPMGNKFQFN